MELIEIEYFDRVTKTVNVGTFISCQLVNMKKGMKYIAIGDRCPKEGRADSPGYMLPLLLKYKSQNGIHIISEGHGAQADDLCFTEYDGFEIDLKI